MIDLDIVSHDSHRFKSDKSHLRNWQRLAYVVYEDITYQLCVTRQSFNIIFLIPATWLYI